jgi:hypothetical protein
VASRKNPSKMMTLYDPKVLYDPATMPLVDEADTFGCSFVRFHWVPSEAEQRLIDAHWRPLFYRHSLINTKMSLATGAGVGVPGWDPFYGLTEAEKDTLEGDAYYSISDQGLGTKLARGQRVEPTGLADDPRLPEQEPAAAPVDIVQMLRDAAARYEAGVQAEHTKMLAEYAALKSGSWAQRAAAPKVAPTLAEARKAYQERLCGPKEPERPWWCAPPTVIPGAWHEWEIVEIERERARQDRVEAAWQRAEAAYKSINPTWGGGT